MKTFKEFCEQVSTSPFDNYKPDGPVKGFVRGLVNKVQSGIQNKLQSINKTATDLRLAAGIHDPKTNYIQRDQASREAKLRLRGVNTKNVSNMPIKKHTSPIQYSSRYAVPKPPAKGFGGKPTTDV